MRNEKQPVFMIGVAAQLCGVHPQTLRQYERLGLVVPSRVGAKNRLYSESDVIRVRQIQRLTQDMGVNLAGVELILKLLDEMETMRADFEAQMEEYRDELQRRLEAMGISPNAPVRRDESLLPAPKIRYVRKIDL
jgi:MerR family transcriptional regulator/heat shock protein HspR